ncbi:PIG-L family deacetylase [Lutibacter sp. B2]|nr:PIG-L family deacetylase [Lutibacter sp. B2]
MSNVLIIAAHPDDELLGCGGTIALHAMQGDKVTVVIVCEGESLRYSHEGVGQQENIYSAAAILGVTDVRLLGFPDQQLDKYTLTEIISPLEQIVSEIKPEIVYCQYGGDINRDHKILFEAASVALRPIVEYLEVFYSFYTVSSTEWAYPRTFIPDTWVDITSTIDKKLEAFSCYKSEIREYPHPRSIETLKYSANFYGSQCCINSAEVFMTIRRVCRNGKTPL